MSKEEESGYPHNNASKELEDNKRSSKVLFGSSITEAPKDLYIPPNALEIFLEAFEGPLDLLLYMIKRQNLNILEINVAEITHQYMSYINLMEAMQLELVSEYLLMAAMLAEIKSRMLLPKEKKIEEDDPRATLILRLQEYERFKKAAEDIDSLPRLNRDNFLATAEDPDMKIIKNYPEVAIQEILFAMSSVLQRIDMHEHHKIKLDMISTRERMSRILSSLNSENYLPFNSLFDLTEGRAGVIGTFLALMELIRESMVEIVQSESYAPIHIKCHR
ncbi:MAG: segregation/condensation protein A [Cellvibrionales bacterium]|jgi:segregation and condensation protein A|nr:segregation/condensation protein A [Cellvibrionales bacterium]MCH9798128.1 segregation/condensation protein A [Gammaproteobacteria bacterium]MDA7737743.1 segregation/condensation protein A [Porticoccus sp.]MBT7436995.1 segregation/condensation protein A [Cellvibrionales bacterium]MCH9843300.1 segregation/condensation protein A [Gammaproteobacteria bacterium]